MATQRHPVSQASWGEEVTTALVPDFELLFDRCFVAIDEAAKRDGEVWHQTEFTEDGIPYVHASGVTGCPRRYVLEALGKATDGNTVDSAMNFAFGNTLHSVLEKGLPGVPEFEGWKAIYSEQGFVHSQMALKGKPDAVWETPTGQPILFDLKTESGQSKRLRERDNIDGIRDEHKVQITAGAMLVEDNTDLRFTTGLVVYVGRKTVLALGKPVEVSKWEFTPKLFEITDTMRQNVVRHVTDKVNAWRNYQTTGELPERLPQMMMYGKLRDDWHCAPRDATDDRGKYCPARTVCMSVRNRLDV